MSQDECGSWVEAKSENPSVVFAWGRRNRSDGACSLLDPAVTRQVFDTTVEDVNRISCASAQQQKKTNPLDRTHQNHKFVSLMLCAGIRSNQGSLHWRH